MTVASAEKATIQSDLIASSMCGSDDIKVGHPSFSGFNIQGGTCEVIQLTTSIIATSAITAMIQKRSGDQLTSGYHLDCLANHACKYSLR
jgi:hypothetical protein